MFICYLLKTILNKIQTMYSQSALALTLTPTRSYLPALSRFVCSRFLCRSLIAGKTFQGAAVGMSSVPVLYMLLLVLVLFCCCGWVVGLLVGSCFVVLCLWKMTPPVGMSMCVCVATPFSHWLSLTNRVGCLPAPAQAPTLYGSNCYSFLLLLLFL